MPFQPVSRLHHSLTEKVLATLQFLQAHFQRRKFAIKIKYAEQPVLVRGRTSDVNAFYEVFILKIYKIPELEVLSVIDAGANVGYASVYFSYFFPKARIIAVEPEASNYQMLVQNTQPYQNIECVEAAIWSEAKVLTLQNPQSANWGYTYRETTMPVNVPGVQAQTLPGLMKKFNFQRINLLKIDIEGAETNLFSANTDWLELVDCLMIEIHSAEARKKVFQALADHPHSYTHDGFNNYHIFLNHSI